MADLKISQLPSVAILDSTDVLPVVDAGLTKQVSVANLNNSLPITTFVQNASSGWGAGAPGASVVAAQYVFEPPYVGTTDNLVNNTDNFVRWNSEAFNTSSSTFEFFGSGTTGARVFVKQTGYYLVISQINYFDLYNGMRLTVKLFRAAGVSPASMLIVNQLGTQVYPSAVLPSGQTLDSSTLIRVTSPGYYTVGLFPTANSPFPSSTDSGASKFTLIKILPL